jgi:hypothetical protein
MAEGRSAVRWPIRLAVAILFYGGMFALAATVPSNKTDAIAATALLIVLNLAVVLVRVAIMKRRGS